MYFLSAFLKAAVLMEKGGGGIPSRGGSGGGCSFINSRLPLTIQFKLVLLHMRLRGPTKKLNALHVLTGSTQFHLTGSHITLVL